MADSSLEELLAEVNALSINCYWSDRPNLVKNCEKHEEDAVLGIIWSEDETCLTDDLEYEHGDLQDLETLKHDLSNCSLPEKDDEPINFLSNVTIRRKPSRKRPEENYKKKGQEEDTLNAIKTLSFDDCFSSEIIEEPIIEGTKSLPEDEDNIFERYSGSKENTQSSVITSSHFEKTKRCLSSRCPSEIVVNQDIVLTEQNVESEVDKTGTDIIENDVSQDIANDVDVMKDSRKYDIIPADANQNKCNEENIPPENIDDDEWDKDILFSSDDESSKHITNIEICSPSNKEKVIIPVTTISSGTDSDCVWESGNESDVPKFETEFQENDCSKHPVQLSNKVLYTTVNIKTHSTEKETRFVRPSNVNTQNSKILSNQSPEVSLTNVIDFSSSDDDFEAFLADIKTPRSKKTPKSTPSVKKFIVDDWINSSDDESSFVNTSPLIFHQKIPPTQTTKTPKPKRTPLKKITLENTPLVNSSVKTIERIVAPYINTPRRSWQKKREELVQELFDCYNETIFGNKLPSDMTILWNKQMTKTAGFCYYIGMGSQMARKCRIELSDKVVDSCERIRDTLIHELCHAATWLIDGVKAGHGPHWKRWALKARHVHSDLPPISRCHSYEINYKFTYKCIKCHHRFGRHSKSINTKIARCPYCLSRLELLPRLKKDGTPAKPRAPSKFSLFVKDNYKKIKENGYRLSHQEIMKELSKRFAQASLNKDDENTENRQQAICL